MHSSFGEREKEKETHGNPFNKYYTITQYCYNYIVARPKSEVAVESWECPRTASRCSSVSYLGHVRPDVGIEDIKKVEEIRDWFTISEG